MAITNTDTICLLELGPFNAQRHSYAHSYDIPMIFADRRCAVGNELRSLIATPASTIAARAFPRENEFILGLSETVKSERDASPEEWVKRRETF